MADPPSKRARTDNGAEGQDKDTLLPQFMKWCEEQRFALNSKVTVATEGSCAHYGMIAKGDIPKGEILFEVPRDCLLHPETSSIREFFENNKDQLDSASGWVPLLVCLMYEFANPCSKWRPYLNLFPNFSEQELPMFWDKQELSELQGTGVPEAVNRDIKNIRHEYENIVLPCISKHPDLFNVEIHNLDLYKKMVAFVMSYSFTEPSKRLPISLDIDDDDENETETHHPPPVMVPMADALNHIAKNNAKLLFDKDKLKMVSTKPIRKEQEIYNTFGELANWQLLHMYGFAEPYPDNIFDTVDIPMKFFLNHIRETMTSDPIVDLNARWRFLEQLDVVSDEGNFVIGEDGILTPEELYTTLKVCTMTKDEFEDYKNKDGWESDEDTEEADIILSHENLHKLPENWKQLLSGVLKVCLEKYVNTIDEDRRLLRKENFDNLSKKRQFALHVRVGQKILLHKTLQAITKEPLANNMQPGQGDHCCIA